MEGVAPVCSQSTLRLFQHLFLGQSSETHRLSPLSSFAERQKVPLFVRLKKLWGLRLPANGEHRADKQCLEALCQPVLFGGRFETDIGSCDIRRAKETEEWCQHWNSKKKEFF